MTHYTVHNPTLSVLVIVNYINHSEVNWVAQDNVKMHILIVSILQTSQYNKYVHSSDLTMYPLLYRYKIFSVSALGDIECKCEFLEKRGESHTKNHSARILALFCLERYLAELLKLSPMPTEYN